MTTTETTETEDMTFNGAVFIATSLDGFIARPNGDIDWLDQAQNAGDLGYQAFMDGIDTVVMGRATYDKVLTFGTGQWPYEGKRVAVLSTRLDTGADDRITVHRDMDQLVRHLTERGSKNVYADGGQVVQSFLRAGLLHEITITTVPVLLGEGLPLFGSVGRDVALTHQSTSVLGDGLVQTTYTVRS